MSCLQRSRLYTNNCIIQSKDPCFPTLLLSAQQACHASTPRVVQPSCWLHHTKRSVQAVLRKCTCSELSGHNRSPGCSSCCDLVATVGTSNSAFSLASSVITLCTHSLCVESDGWIAQQRGLQLASSRPWSTLAHGLHVHACTVPHGSTGRLCRAAMP